MAQLPLDRLHCCVCGMLPAPTWRGCRRVHLLCGFCEHELRRAIPRVPGVAPQPAAVNSEPMCPVCRLALPGIEEQLLPLAPLEVMLVREFTALVVPCGLDGCSATAVPLAELAHHRASLEQCKGPRRACVHEGCNAANLAEHEYLAHSHACHHRPRICPLSAACAFFGPPRELRQHLLQVHSAKPLVAPTWGAEGALARPILRSQLGVAPHGVPRIDVVVATIAVDDDALAPQAGLMVTRQKGSPSEPPRFEVRPFFVNINPRVEGYLLTVHARVVRNQAVLREAAVFDVPFLFTSTVSDRALAQRSVVVLPLPEAELTAGDDDVGVVISVIFRKLSHK